ncbi:MAG: hypothetical protein LDL31_03735 [Prosthecobacter sp.]|jgi:hypothetical protein|nr:hypothetical protein [Prosthecobacter sp.]
MKTSFSFLILALVLLQLFDQAAYAQAVPDKSSDGQSPERVQYTLILPDEKTPETIRPEENNPFEAIGDKDTNEGDTEENRVRSILQSMPAKGGGFGPQGMRVMLGSMRLEAGQEVPPVLPDQEVVLKVKSITPTQIELVWVEKKPTGLPPKPFVIDVDVSPKVRVQLPAGTGTAASAPVGLVKKEGMSAFNRAHEEETRPVETAARALPVEDAPSVKSAPPPANVPEASVLRMLFGNHAQKK